MKTLHLTLKKKWFDMIASGEKKEEYREIKMFWCTRLLHGFTATDISFGIHELNEKYKTDKGFTLLDALVKDYETITFTNGYSKNAPKIVVEFLGLNIGKAKPKWSDNWKGNVFVIKLGDIIK